MLSLNALQMSTPPLESWENGYKKLAVWIHDFTTEKVSKQPKNFLKPLLQNNLHLSCLLYAQ